jgi:protein-S-isoprenylcysteine O-methyltransferase Ste14
LYWIPFLVFSLILLIVTLIRPHPYRFSRFAAFECVLGLVFLNAEAWFAEALSPRQIFSWILLILSIGVVVSGLSQLKSEGFPEGDFAETTRLVTGGIYRYIRHLMYSSLLLMGGGAFLKSPSWWGLGILIVLVLGVIRTAAIEEKANLARFGEGYQAYRERTKRFIPFVW